MIKKLASILLVIGILAISLSPMLVSATNPYNTYYGNSTYDGGLWAEATSPEAEELKIDQEAHNLNLADNSTTLSCQTFTPQTTFTLSKVSVWMYGDMGDTQPVGLALYATLAGQPTGAVLAHGLLYPGQYPVGAENATWVDFTVGGYTLSRGTVYAISVWNVVAADTYNYGYSADIYAGGQQGTSLDSGTTWTMYSAYDMAIRIYGQDSPYAIAHEATVGTVTTGITMEVGQMYASTYGTYRVFRAVAVFDTSGLSMSDNIQSATLQVWVCDNYSTTDFTLTLVDSSGCSVPLATSDYYLSGLQEVSLGSVTTAGISTTAYTTITLNATGLSKISRTGYTVIGIRSSKDISITAPTGNEYVSLYTGESAYPPILTISYTVGAMIAPDEMKIESASVFTNYKEVGDELFVWHNTLRYDEVPQVSPQGFFVVELRDSTDTIVAQTVVNEWGYSPLSIYLSAAQVATSGTFWDTTCSLVMEGTSYFGTPPGYSAFSYSVTDGDWKGLNGVLTDAWVKTCCNWLEDENGVSRNTYSTTGTSGGWCINPSEKAQVLFLEGIPYLDTSRPNLFLTGGDVIAPGTATTGVFAGSIYSTIWGTYWRTGLGYIGASVGVSGQLILSVLASILILVAGYYVREKTNTASLALLVMSLLFVCSVALGMFPLIVLCILTVGCAMLLLQNFVMSRM